MVIDYIVKLPDGRVALDLECLFRDWMKWLYEHDIMQVLKGLALDDRVAHAVIERLANGDRGFFSGKDREMQRKCLEAMREQVLNDLDWSIISEFGVAQRLKNRREAQHIYWAMYHDPEHADFFRKWLDEKGFTSNYTTERADADIEAIRNEVRQLIVDLKASLPPLELKEKVGMERDND